MRRPIDPKSYEPQLTGLRSRLAEIDAKYAAEQAKLDVTPDDPEIAREAAALVVQRRELEAQRNEVLGAQARAEKRYAKAQRETFVQQLVTDTRQTDAILGYAQATTEEIIGHLIGNVSPLLVRLRELSQEAGALAWGVARASGLKRDQVPDIPPLFAVMIERALHDAGLASIVALPRRPEMRDDTVDRYRRRANEVLYDAIRATASDMAVPDPVAPVKSMDRVELVAIDRGHVQGRVVEAGQRFMHDPTPKYPGGAPRPAPKWAKPPKEAAEIVRSRAQRSHDLKPKAATEAVVEKAAEARRALHR